MAAFTCFYIMDLKFSLSKKLKKMDFAICKYYKCKISTMVQMDVIKPLMLAWLGYLSAKEFIDAAQEHGTKKQ